MLSSPLFFRHAPWALFPLEAYGSVPDPWMSEARVSSFLCQIPFSDSVDWALMDLRLCTRKLFFVHDHFFCAGYQYGFSFSLLAFFFFFSLELVDVPLS